MTAPGEARQGQPLRYVQISLVFLVAIWASLSVITNLADLGMTIEAVRNVTAMPMFEPGVGPFWKTENALIVAIGVGFIILGKVATAILCTWGGGKMIGAVRSDAASFHASKYWALVGSMFTVAWLFAGFAVVGETAFFMYLDPQGYQVSETAFRYAGYVGLIGLIVAYKD